MNTWKNDGRLLSSVLLYIDPIGSEKLNEAETNVGRMGFDGKVDHSFIVQSQSASYVEIQRWCWKDFYVTKLLRQSERLSAQFLTCQLSFRDSKLGNDDGNHCIKWSRIFHPL